MMNRRTAIQAIAGTPAVFLPSAQSTPPGAGATNARDYGAIGDGIADDTAALRAALTAAQASDARCLYIPAGIYKVAPVSGDLLSLTAPGMTVCGDGIGRTVLQDADNIVITNHARRIALNAPYQTVRDLSIYGSASMSGTYDTGGVNVRNGGLYFRVARVEVAGIYGYGSAGGSAFDCYQDPNVGGGRQFGVMEDCIARDMPLCTGFGTASSNNAFVRCIALRCGNTTTRHAFYAQGGYNRFEQCYAESAGGFSYHAHKQSQALDASGDQYIGCVSINPGLKHMIVDSYQTLTRYVTIRDCLFKGSAEGIDFRVPALIDGCVFEDVGKVGQSTIIVNQGATGSQVRGNRITTAVRGTYGVFVGVPATIEGNAIEGIYGTGINVTGPGALIRGNRLNVSSIPNVQSVVGIGTGTTNAVLDGNLIGASGVGVCISMGNGAAVLRNNILEPRNGAAAYAVNGPAFAGPMGSDVVR